MHKHQSSGFILVTVLFLITVLAAMAIVLSSTTSVQNLTTMYSLEQARAFAAARSGLEYGIQRAAVPLGGGVCTNSAVALPGINFTVTVSCSSVAGINEAGNLSTVYQITSTASTGTLGVVGYVTRTVRSTVSNP
jgi:MSHA biogenesis protein MshP